MWAHLCEKDPLKLTLLNTNRQNSSTTEVMTSATKSKTQHNSIRNTVSGYNGNSGSALPLFDQHKNLSSSITISKDWDSPVSRKAVVAIVL
ncbi:unnamed protein product [Clavelina lepadiformis]|uniref:Uncharacterized protein n=1 Tax=Clavelina lepadiformis TaxID=159417 RepID=A0ABP0GUR5_CLALP